MSATDRVKQIVFERAERAGYEMLTISDRRKLYEEWTSDPEIGGALKQVMPASRVRVFLKDTIIGEYLRSRKAGIEDVLRAQGIQPASIDEAFIKPKGWLINGGELHTVCQAAEWKIALLNSFQRAAERPYVRSNTLYITNHVRGQFVDPCFRRIVESAGKRLDVQITWVH
jgi:hypothetical protein